MEIFGYHGMCLCVWIVNAVHHLSDRMKTTEHKKNPTFRSSPRNGEC